MIKRDRKVRLVALKRQYKQSQKRLFLCPIEESDGSMVTGLELLNDTEIKKLNPIVVKKAEGTLSIADGETLDLMDDLEFIIYLRCLIYDIIANTDIARNGNHLFYIHDEEFIAERESEKTEKIFDALTFIKDMNDNQFRDLAIFLGIDTNNVKPSLVRSHVRSKSMKEPELVVKFKDMDNRENDLFAKKAVAYKVISRRSNGYFFEDRFLSSSSDGLTVELFKNENSHVRTKISHMVTAIENPSKKNANILMDDLKNDDFTKELNKKDKEIKIKDLLFSFYKLTGTDYDGPMEIKDIESAISIAKKLNGSNTNENANQKTDALKIQEKVESFLLKAGELDESGIRKSLKMRGVDHTKVDEIEPGKTQELIDLGVEHIKANS